MTPRRTPLLPAMLLAGCLASSACQQRSLYEWGSYEDHLYQYLASGKPVDLDAHARKLATDIRNAEQKRRIPGPGVHAELGYLLYLKGRYDEARQQFAAEKAAFPESATLMDGILARMDRGKAQPGESRQ